MPEEAHEIRISDPADMTGLEDFFPSHDKAGQEDLSLEEAAKRLNLSERTIQRRLKRGQLTGYKINGDRGPEWRIKLQSGEDMTLHAVPPSEDTTIESEVMPDIEAVSSDDKTADRQALTYGAIAQFTGFYQDQIETLQEKLEAATYRNGYLEAQLEVAGNQLKLLPDLSAKASKVELIETEMDALRKQLEAVESSLWFRFRRWFFGKGDQ